MMRHMAVDHSASNALAAAKARGHAEAAARRLSAARRLQRLAERFGDDEVLHVAKGTVQALREIHDEALSAVGDVEAERVGLPA